MFVFVRWFLSCQSFEQSERSRPNPREHPDARASRGHPDSVARPSEPVLPSEMRAFLREFPHTFSDKTLDSLSVKEIPQLLNEYKRASQFIAALQRHAGEN